MNTILHYDVQWQQYISYWGVDSAKYLTYISPGRPGYSLCSLFNTLNSTVEGQLGIVRVGVTHINVTIDLSRPLIDILTGIKCATHSLIGSRMWYSKQVGRQLEFWGILAIYVKYNINASCWFSSKSCLIRCLFLFHNSWNVAPRRNKV